MAIIQDFEPMVGFVAENAYHHIATIQHLDFTAGVARCRVVSYKDKTVRQAHKALIAELKVMGKESEALHLVLSEAGQKQDALAAATAQRDLAVKAADIELKAQELSAVGPWGEQEISLDVADILESGCDITRAVLYAKLKEQEAFKDAVDA